MALSNDDYLKINNLFPTDEYIDALIERFKEKGRRRLPQKYKHFFLEGNELKYSKKPPNEYASFAPMHQPRVYPTITIVKKADIPATLEALYENDTNTYGKGIVSFYKYVRTMYGNITRKDVADFLKAQDLYQLGSVPQTVIRRPITASYPNQIWSCDLIDMKMYAGHNKQRHYIMNCVDIFSRKCFLEPLLHKSAVDTRDALKRIIKRTRVQPTTIRSDNGLEFFGEFKDFCKEKGITNIYSQSHTPTQNAVVERANKDIRKIIRNVFVDTKSKDWLSHLADIESAKNTTYNSTIRSIPNQAWEAVNRKQPVRLSEQLMNSSDGLDIARFNHVKNQQKAKAKYEYLDNFEVGDKVRVAMTELFANQRKTIKDGNGKQLVVHYSPKIYEVASVTHSRVGHNLYTLRNPTTGDLLSVKGGGKTFKADKLMRVDADAEDADMTYAEALKLNGITGNANDVEFI